MTPRQVDMIIKEVSRLQDVLGSRLPGYKVRATTQITRTLLLRGMYFYEGKQCNPKAKSIGAGVYEIWLDE